LIPLDYKDNGQITDDTLYELLVDGFKKGVYVTFLIDCCHSGSVLDLPFEFTANGKGGNSMVANQRVIVSLGGVVAAKLKELLDFAGRTISKARSKKMPLLK
jgi:hypothetical protein